MRAVILTISDSASKGERVDESGAVIREILQKAEYEIAAKEILPDEQEQIFSRLCEIADKDLADLVVTTGGTGFSQRDVTPEATIQASQRLVPGIPEAMRAYSMQFTDRAMLSRQAAGIRKKTLIINLPGSPKAVRECLEYIMPPLCHGLEILKTSGGNCAR